MAQIFSKVNVTSGGLHAHTCTMALTPLHSLTPSPLSTTFCPALFTIFFPYLIQTCPSPTILRKPSQLPPWFSSLSYPAVFGEINPIFLHYSYFFFFKFPVTFMSELTHQTINSPKINSPSCESSCPHWPWCYVLGLCLVMESDRLSNPSITCLWSWPMITND